MAGTMTLSAGRSADGLGTEAPPELTRNLVFLVRRALKSGLGPPELVRWVRDTAASYGPPGAASVDQVARRVAQELGRALVVGADTCVFGSDVWKRTVAG
jgi:hypothetical protein